MRTSLYASYQFPDCYPQPNSIVLCNAEQTASNSMATFSNCLFIYRFCERIEKQKINILHGKCAKWRYIKIMINCLVITKSGNKMAWYWLDAHNYLITQSIAKYNAFQCGRGRESFQNSIKIRGNWYSI